MERHPDIAMLQRESPDSPWRIRLTKSPKGHGACQAVWCRNMAKLSRCGRNFCRTCNTCNNTMWRANNPIRTLWWRVRESARKRSIAFNLTIDEFTQWCEQTQYHILRGKAAGDLSIDRIDPSRGYELGNIQAITIRQNVQKQHQDQRAATCPEPDEWTDEWPDGEPFQPTDENPF